MTTKSLYQQVLEINKAAANNKENINKASSEKLVELNMSHKSDAQLPNFLDFEKSFREMDATDILGIFLSMDNEARNLIINKGNK